MPRFSVVIPSFGNADYLPDALESVLKQSFGDWEIIVVDDASTDGSLEIAKRFSRDDGRIRVIERERNGGPHLARKAGVEACRGEYVLFLDPDDELVPESLGKLDCRLSGAKDTVVHFGMEIVPQEGSDPDSVKPFTDAANAPCDILHGKEVLAAPFNPAFGFVHDWRITQRAFPADLTKRAFGRMTCERLDRAEDAYECFVLVSLARVEETDNDIVVYRYNIGRGVTGSSMLSKEEFGAVSQRFADCCEAVDEYVSGKADHVVRCAQGLSGKLIEAAANEWHERVADEDKLDAARLLASAVGYGQAAAQLMRFVRDDSYGLIESGFDETRYNVLLSWKRLSDEFAQKADTDLANYTLFSRTADYYLRQLKERQSLRTARRGDIRIFVSTHKDVDFFESEILQPIQVGSANADCRFGGVLHDDRGDNISDLNPMYCELTTQYWAWKNVEADYYGFCHYRRYFDFSSNRHPESVYGEVIDRYIDKETQAKYCLDDASIEKLVRQYDVITTEIKDLRKFPGGVDTPRNQYHVAPRLVDADLDRAIGILKEMHPDYAQDADAFLDGNHSCFCNMFIMRRDIFFDYCEWLFPMLQKFVEQTDMSLYSKEALRTPGHLSERLFNIYYQHHARVGAGWKTKQLQCVRFECPDRVYDLLPPGDTGLMPVIPVVFAADGNYVPMLTTTIHSMLANASSDYYYDIFVFARGMSSEDMRIMRQVYAEPGKVSLTFYDVSRIVESYELATNNAHISIETYYRFLVQELLPHYDKVLYLDSDIIVSGDVSQLYATELGDNLLAAVRDLDFLGNVNMKGGERMRYAKDVLGMKDPYAYFQAGVLVLNTAAMRNLHSVKEWLKFASDSRYIYNDQDILNAECEGRVLFLDYRWNVMTDCMGRIANVLSYAPLREFEAYLASRNDQLITHYAGAEKPWTKRSCDMAPLYWRYARQTPFYERLVCILCGQADDDESSDDHEYAIDVNSPMRRFIDPIMPYGSRRREAVKSVVRKIRGRK